MFENKKFYILGMGSSGYAVALLLSKFNNDILVTDIKKQENKRIKSLKKKGIKVEITELPEELLDGSFDYLVRSPGVQEDNPVVMKAIMLNIPIVNDIEIGYYFLPEDVYIIGITGTMGKTTSTVLIDKLLSNTKQVFTAGNRDIPLCSLIGKIKSKDILVLELSARQLHNIKNFKTNISIITNIINSNNQFYQHNQEYFDDKIKIFNLHTAEDIAIINSSDKKIMEMIEYIPDKKITFSPELYADAYIDNNNIYYQTKKIVSLENVMIRGIHNYENLLVGVIMAELFEIDCEKISKILTTYPGVENRLEFVKYINDRYFYNDSASITCQAVELAVLSFKQPIILIMGGMDENQDFGVLIPTFKKVKEVICYGETKNKIKKVCNDIGVKCTTLNILGDAIVKSFEVSKEEDAILFSPGCKSLDQYKDYKERGKEFKTIVGYLK